ncbi:MAG: nuclear transport factor 2 family protein [Acidimicrobiia bacterium]|nr:nuclear transport factor 2 family protein [Acidimicrobiia bacterium]
MRTPSSKKPAFNVVVAMAAFSTLMSACSSSGSASSMPKPILSETEVQQLRDEAGAFADRSITAWPDIDAFVADYAEDIRGADPTHSDYCCKGKDATVAYWRRWAAMSDYTINVTGMYLSADGAAYEEAWPGLWPSDYGFSVPGPRDPEGSHALDIHRFRDGQVTWGEVWYPPDENERFGFGCFAIDGCPSMQETVDRYITAWSLRASNAVAALYSRDAVFTDSLLGLEATGADEIGDLAAGRFGSAADLSIEVLGLYAWTDGHSPPTEAAPDRGRLVGVAIHYRAEVDDNGVAGVQEAITTLHLGTLHETSFDADPQGLIHIENVYHEPATLLAALQE